MRGRISPNCRFRLSLYLLRGRISLLSSKKVLPRVLFSPSQLVQPRPSQQLVADVRSGMERLVVEYATESMLNIVPGRNSDLGSSCCAFFAARWGSRVMQAVSLSQRVESLLTLGAVQQMLAACVSEYDNRGAVDGSFPIESFQEETKRLGRGAEVVV